MKLFLISTYKSLQPFESDFLTPLTVITGKNGSGKSQLLSIICDNYYQGKKILALDPNPNKVQLDGIVKNDLQSFTFHQWQSINSHSVDQFQNNLSLHHRELLFFLAKRDIEVIDREVILRALTKSDHLELNQLVTKGMGKESHSSNHSASSVEEGNLQYVLSLFSGWTFSKLLILLNQIWKKTGKSSDQISQSDFYNVPFDDHVVDQNDLFTSQIELIFYNYAKRRYLNDISYYRKVQYGKSNDSIHDNEFIERYPIPWQTINRMLEENSIDFEFKCVENEDFSTDVTFVVRFVRKSTDEEIPFNDLSSGEKVIIGLILKMFTSEHYKENLSFPDLILLDEPDAHLHPEMTHLLINVLQETFVKSFGIRVIMTTHSPSTIALVDEGNIYQLTNGISSSLKKVSKDDALKLLTSFIPTLSIDYKNHKQVFVESPTDQFYYQKIFDRLNQSENYPFKLYFISNGYGKGSSSQVVETVKAIRIAENKSFFGIIDWDKKNEHNDFVFVHGQSERYSLENYLYDPLYIIILFMVEEALNIYSELELDLSYNPYDLPKDSKLCKKAVKWFFDRMHLEYPAYKNGDVKKVTFYNNEEFELPVWYLEENGHTLEGKLKKAFRPLEKYVKEGDLQKELTIISARCFPFIHSDTVSVFEKIINK